jgi:hypothetical protein
MVDTSLARGTTRKGDTHSCKMFLPMDAILAEKSIEAMPILIKTKDQPAADVFRLGLSSIGAR